MRSHAVLALLSVVVLAGCSVSTGSGQLTSDTRQVSGFSKVEFTGPGELAMEQTGTESLTISAEDNLLPKLTSEVSGGTLILGPVSGAKIGSGNVTYSGDPKRVNQQIAGSGKLIKK